MNIREELFKLRDEDYKHFQSRLMPTVDPELIVGVRAPQLRALAKEFSKTPDAAEFLKQLPHKYYEENNLHALLIGEIKDFEKALEERQRFLPYVDNWATCDMPMPRVFAKNAEKLVPDVEKWLESDHVYTVRYGIKVLMDLFLDERYEEHYAELVAAVHSEEYYVKMMIAWYFATALAKQKDSILPFLTEKRLDPWVHNKTIQKATESYRIDKATKDYLKTLKI